MSHSLIVFSTPDKGVQSLHWPHPIPSEALRLLAPANYPDPQDAPTAPVVHAEFPHAPKYITSDTVWLKIGTLRKACDRALYDFWERRDDQSISYKLIYLSFERHLRNSIESLVTEATRSVPEDYSAAVETHFRDYLFAYHFDLLVNGYRPCLLQSIYHIALAGLCPIMWKGTWPQGFCYVYIPPTHPWATSGIPAAWQASPEVVKQANRRVKPQPQVALAVPNEAPADWSALRTLVATRSPVEALAAWWEPWAETPRCRQVLQRIAAVVQRLEVDGRCLRIHTDLTDLSQAVVIEARAPATSDLPPLPRSAAALVRRHNGITLIDGQRREVFSPSLARGRFPVEFALWWTPDPDDPAEPFRKPPIVPCSDGQDIWAYHQLRERAPGEPELRRIDHEGGDLRAALHYGAPGVILRLIHEAIRKDGPDGRRDHGLRLDHGDIHGEANVL